MKLEKSSFQSTFYKIAFLFILTSLMIFSYNDADAQQKDMMVRIAEIEILPEYLEEYKAILKEESSASVKIEPGVICIFPMFQKENPTQIRLVEIYADKAAYQAHIQSPHFQHYKTTTLKMVKSLKLIEMSAIDPEMMQEVFRKMK